MKEKITKQTLHTSIFNAQEDTKNMLAEIDKIYPTTDIHVQAAIISASAAIISICDALLSISAREY